MTRAEAFTSFDKSAGTQAIELLPKLSRSSDNECFHLIDGLGTCHYS